MLHLLSLLACSDAEESVEETDTRSFTDTSTYSAEADSGTPTPGPEGTVALTNNTDTPIGLVAWETADAYGESPFFPPAAPAGGYFGSLTYPVGSIELTAIGDDGRCASEMFTIVEDQVLPWVVDALPGVWETTAYGGNCTIGG